jgi:hypothetical protein
MMADSPKQRQMGVALPDDLRQMLEFVSARSGKSIAEEIRNRLWLTFRQDDVAKPVKNFMAEIGLLVSLTGRQTGQNWRTHPAANAVLRHAINARLARTKKSGPETFAPGELPDSRAVAPGSDDPQIMGIALEAHLEAQLNAALAFSRESAEWVLNYMLEEEARKARLPPEKETLPPNPPETREQLPPMREEDASLPPLPPAEQPHVPEELLPPAEPPSRPKARAHLPPDPRKSRKAS